MEQSTTSWVKDVTDRDFQREVIERSRTVPVVVDLWAPWCGPCKQLGPLLERLAAEGGGKWILAKVNVDESPQVARALGVQSIPLVLAFKDADVVSEFVGAQPETVVRQFVERIVPDEARRLIGEALQLAQRGDTAGAEAKLRDVLRLFPENATAAVSLAKLLVDAGRDDDAMKVLDDSTATGAAAAEIEQARAALRLRGGVNGDEGGLRARVEADPKDYRARIDLGRLLSASGRFEEALALLLETVRLDRNFDDGAARKAMLDVFALLGREHPLVDRYQRELSRLLFS
ncbi:MAG: co-chaperone YbbN [Deltaproteobacteria bacterium]|nr:co-chaperone YbbN [Deltaproteobacteria bacterium]